MPTAQELKLRQEILNEWRAKTSLDDALSNIRKKLGGDSVTINKVMYWYKRFDKGDTSLIATNSPKNIPIQSSSKKNYVDSISVLIQDKCLKNSVYTSDGRLAVLSCEVTEPVSVIAFYDLFHGIKRTIKVYDSSLKLTSDFQFSIVENYLLAIYGRNLCFFKVNYDTWEISASSLRILDGYFSQIISDQLDKLTFLVYASNMFQTGQINDDQIQLNGMKNIGNIYLRCTTLVSNKLRGFAYDNNQDMSSLKFYEIDVSTLQQTKFDSPVAIENQVPLMMEGLYSWIDNRCYALFNAKVYAKNKILSFNLDTRLWSDTQVSAKNVTQLFVDSNEVLTLQDETTFYRSALKKPQFLKNLTWFTILHSSSFMESKLYEKIVNRLPYNCGLHCLFNKNSKEETEEQKKAILPQSFLPVQTSAQQFPSTPQQAHQILSPVQQSMPIPQQSRESFLSVQSSAQQLPLTPQQPVHIHTLRPFREASFGESNSRVGKNKSSFSIRICSFNVLCETRKTKRAHLYTDPRQKIDWNERQKLISDDIELLNADIFCLQEVQENHYTTFFKSFFNERGFKTLFSKRYEEIDGCLIAYRNDNRYKELKFKDLSYNRNAHNFTENNVGQLLLLEEVKTGIVFLVVNTQLLVNLHLGEIKTGQIAFLLASIDFIEDEFYSRHNYAGVLLCGNFNFQPYSPLYNFVRKGQLNYSMYHPSLLAFNQSLNYAQQQQQKNKNQPGFILDRTMFLDPRTCKFAEYVIPQGLIDTFTHQQRYLSAYRHHTDNNEREVSTFNKYYSCPDFIFYSGTQLSRDQIGESRIMIKKLLALPSHNAIQESCGPMPNEQCGSDHLPLMAEFTLI